MSYIVEQDVENAAIEILIKDLNYSYLYGPDIAPNGKTPLRNSWDEVVLIEKLKEAIDTNSKNRHLPQEAKEEALKKVLRHSSPNTITNNEIFHKYLVEGIEVEYRHQGRIKGDKAYLIDLEDSNKNDFLVVNQFTIIEDKHERRPDLVLFVNGLPLIVIELKNPADKNATILSAYEQIQTYKRQIPSLFNFNEGIIVADGTMAKAGTLSSSYEWFMPWKTIDGVKRESKSKNQLEVLLKGMCRKEILLDLIINFVGYMKTKKDTIKIIAGYHQYHATNKAIESSVNAVSSKDKEKKKVGVVWHTQGSGKSLTMVFYAGKLAKDLRLKNPTIVVLTDRNDLDQQLFDTFSDYQNILRESPKKIKSQADLKETLKVDSGGIFFTTIQKFMDKNSSDFEKLSDRDNIIVVADEAHRTQYGFKGKIRNNILKFGLAKYLRDALPNASYLGFTGTPIDLADKSTRAVFGNYIDIYDMQAALEDNRVVKIFYDSKLVKIGKNDINFEHLDDDVDEITEFEERNKRESLKSRWARIEALLGTEDRIKTIAKTFVRHFELRQSVMDGKAMIVCASRRICIDLHDEIKKLKPEWYNSEDEKGVMKVIMTGSAKDNHEWQEHIRDKKRRKELGDTFKDANSEFKIAIVRDMWLTGFDVPSLNTIYIDKEIKEHNLMQAIARVNRVYKNKQGGLVVDFYGIAEELKKAITIYSENGGAGKPTYDLQVAINLMIEKFNIVDDMLHEFDYKKFFKVGSKGKMRIIPELMEYILTLDDGKKRFIRNVMALKKSYSLASSTAEAKRIRDEVALFEAIANAYKKTETGSGGNVYTTESAIKQLVSKAVSSYGVIDIYKELSFDKPEISILSDRFLTDIEHSEHKNLAFEALKKLLNDEIKVRFEANKVQSKKFSEKLEEAIRKYQNKSIDSAQVILELIDIAKEVKEAQRRGEALGLSDDEVAFYDALANNESAYEILGDDVLKQIAKELSNTIRKHASIDWKFRDAVRAKLKVMVKRLLKKYGYPPDKALIATELVLEQAEVFSDRWVDDNFYKPYTSANGILNESAILEVAEDKEEYKKNK